MADTKIKNVGAASDDESQSTVEEQDGNETTIDLDISLEKLTLGPQKKLLVLPLAGIIVHRAHVRSPETIPKNRRPDFSYGKFRVYKRPFCEEFLKFCFERFQVGLWSSAMEHNLEKVITDALGELKNKFVFTWDQNQCTQTGFMCLHNEKKPVFLKQIKYIWEKHPNENYSSSNTLLITDPEKALLNPPYTAIFPKKYDFDDEDDDFLGPNGELRAFLDGLSEAKDVRSYVRDNPFGEPAITPSHPDWKYYSQIIRFYVKRKSDNS